jgi:GNAT superfamily N-acetyltransferase
MIQIQPANSKQDIRKFIDFPHELYKHDPLYVPELFIAQRDMLTPGKHPFHKHSRLQLFLAVKENKIVGRIAAIQNNNHNEFNNDKDGFFGFYDSINDKEVAAALIDTATSWLRAQGLDKIVGPVNFSTNDTCGMLMEGYELSPVAMMTYNRPYYHEQMEYLGLSKKVDLIAWKIESGKQNDRVVKLQQALRQRLVQKGITLRTINMKQFRSEVPLIKEVYNKAWDKNLGFVPMTDEEFDYLAKDLKLLLDPDFCLIAEHEGKFVGFALCVPDINQVLIKIKKGRLFPTGLLKLLTQRKKINAIRVIALGVLEPYRKMGIEATFYATIIEKCLEKGIRMAEASWILEHNEMMNRAIANINGEAYKKYRIYEKAL